MAFRYGYVLICALALGWIGATPSTLFGYELQGNGWRFTASGIFQNGEPATVTWSIVPDGTAMPSGQGESQTPSSLISLLDSIHHPGQSPAPGGTDLTQRTWFSLIESAFARWDAVCGIRFVYTPADDGVTLGSAGGSLGVRGDHRIGGHPIDGGGSILAYNYYPHNSDMVIDTNDQSRWANASNNYRNFRNMLMHEIGHGMGIRHTESSTHRFLLEPSLSTQFDGPQFDDILAAHRFYGDRYEELGGNDTAGTATHLGSIFKDQTISLGKDAVDAVIAANDIDFVSINKSSDIDFYRFTATIAGDVSIVLTPLGPTYNSGPQGGTQTSFNAKAQVDLSLFLYDSTGTNLLGSSTTFGLGVFESLLDLPLDNPGDYLIRISGSQDAAQFYQLDITLVPEPAAFSLSAMCLLGLLVAKSRRRR